MIPIGPCQQLGPLLVGVPAELPVPADLPAGVLRVTEVVPAAEWGREITDDTTAFHEAVVAARDGALDVVLRDSPIVIEPLQSMR